MIMQIMNPFQVNNFFLYPLKSTENMSLSDAFRGYRRGVMCPGMEKYLNCLLHVCNTIFFLLSPGQVTLERS